MDRGVNERVIGAALQRPDGPRSLIANPPPRLIPDETGFLGLTNIAKHPVELLVEEANQKFGDIIRRQSHSLEEAATGCRRRYEREPPPGLDHWYDAAVESDTAISDNFDTVVAAFERYSAFSVQETRARVQGLNDANGCGMYMINIDSHTQRVSVARTKNTWASYKYNITMEWIQTFIDFLSSMDIASEATNEELDKAILKCPNQLRNNTNFPHVAPRPPVEFEDHAYEKHYEIFTISCPPKQSSNTPNPKNISSNGISFVRNVIRARDVCKNPTVADLHCLEKQC